MGINKNSGGNRSGNKSVNFGGGLELLMNDKIKDSGKPTSDIELDDLNNLENELNNLVEDIPSNSFKPKSDLFSSPSSFFEEKQGVRFSDEEPSIGQSTSQTSNNTKTWDGFGKFNDIPMNKSSEKVEKGFT